MKKVLLICLALAACSSNPPRRPAESENASLKTRDGETVIIPSLVDELKIPACAPGVPAGSPTDECIPAGEAELFDGITQVSGRFHGGQNPVSQKISQRDFHPKQHGCLAARWEPLPRVPANLRVGIFALKKPVSAVMRFSNGSPKSPAGDGGQPPDARPDSRGLAVKLVGVPGQSLLDVEDAQNGLMNHDLVFINDPDFFLRTPKSYPQFISLLTQGKPFFQILDALEISVLKRTMRPIESIAGQTFFSQTPYRLGGEKVKYRLKPCAAEVAEPVSAAEAKDPNFLRRRLAKKLEESSLCYTFSVQVRTPNLPVEDAAVNWPETEAPFVISRSFAFPAGKTSTTPPVILSARIFLSILGIPSRRIGRPAA